MKLILLTAVLSAVLTTPISTAPTPEPLEIVLSIDATDQVAPKQAKIPQTASAIFHGADPDAWFGSAVPVNGKSFPIENDLSVSYITLQGFAGCVFYGIDGSETSVKTFGIPQTVPVGPPQKQVNGTCKDPNTVLTLDL